MNNDERLEISTPLGKLICLKNEDKDYPAFNIYLKDTQDLIAIIEYDSSKRQLRNIAYVERKDEPDNITVFKGQE